MALATSTALIAGGIAAAGALGSAASAIGKKDPKFDSDSLRNINMGGQGILGQAGQSNAYSSLGNLGSLRGDASFGAQNDLAALLQQYSQNGALPTDADNQRARSFAATQFDPQRVAMQQSFQDQLVQANRQAALSGRGVNDPILRAKLAQEQTRQSSLLQSQQGAFASQFAMQQPLQRLQFAEGRANVLTQNFQQRLGLENNIFATGLQAQNQDFSQRFSQFQAELNRAQAIAGGKFQQDAAETTPLQRMGGVISGVVGGLGAGLGAVGPLNSIFGGAGAGGGMSTGTRAGYGSLTMRSNPNAAVNDWSAL